MYPMTGRIARIGTLSLALALVAMTAPGELVEPLADEEADSLAPTAEAHVCVLQVGTDNYECPRDGCDDERFHVHVPRHGPSCIGVGPLKG
ncbi:hypothetical protein BRD56_04300 [Thermoplasmatales archaeon SW_10_69_26]|nr:MAG: hypothetical protein BRD56_04300 [Thermoplasmatales archaeon SW_10_69_26]